MIVAGLLWEVVKIAAALLALMFISWTGYNLFTAMCRVNAVAAARHNEKDEAKHNDD